MKIAEPDSIKAGEQELINSIMEQLNSEIIESLASGRLAVNNLEFRNGDMIIHKNRIVYKMEFETSVSVSVLFDREGNLIDENDDHVEDEQMSQDNVDEEILEAYEQDIDEVKIDESFVSDDINIEAIHSELSAETEEPETNEDDELESVLAKSRDFWLQQSQEAIEPVETEQTESADDQLQDVMQKNKEFWLEQASAAASPE